MTPSLQVQPEHDPTIAMETETLQQQQLVQPGYNLTMAIAIVTQDTAAERGPAITHSLRSLSTTTTTTTTTTLTCPLSR